MRLDAWTALKLPRPPKRGALAIQGVRQSQHFSS